MMIIFQPGIRLCFLLLPLYCLFIASLLAYNCFLLARKHKIKGYFELLLFALLLFVMSADEIARFHETVGGYLANITNLSDKSYSQHSSWVWIGGPLVIAIFALFLFRLKDMLLMVPKSTFYLAAGFSSIILGGIFLESTINFLNHDELQWIWDIEIVVEETLEMAGTLLIAYSLLIWRDFVIKDD
jgi:hypothetical protein